jgi:acetyl-CoA carboxylase biotin carboxyl carrier protein
VADDASKGQAGPFDVRTIKSLVALMANHDLSEIDLHDGQQRIRLRRGPHGVTMLPAPAAAALPATPQPTPPAVTKIDGPPAPAKKFIEIKSPTPGTFYASPLPDAPAFVKVGSKVTPQTVVCLIEAMKIFNEITADCTGTLVEILAENQQAVEYGQVLFRVDPTT